MADNMFDPVPMQGGALGAQASGPRLGVEGGETTGQTIAGKDWFRNGMTASFGEGIPEFLNEAFAPALAAAKQERMWQGFTKAREGATMQEITESQPWYTRLFGPTDYQMGAQLYTVQKQTADMEADFVQRMPELRKLPAEAMAQEFNRMTQERLTGDQYADALLTKQFMDRAGPLMDLHTKARVAWQQGEQVRMQVDAITSASTAYQASMRANAELGKDTPLDPKAAESMVQLRRSLFDTMQTSKYQTDGSIKDVYFSAIRGMADRGESYSIRALVDAGVLGALDADDAQKLQSYVDTAESKNRQRWSTDSGAVEDIARLHAAMAHGAGGQPVMDMALAINKRYEAETGALKPYYDADQIGGFAGQGMNSYIREANRLADQEFQRSLKAEDAAAKEAAESRNATQAVDAFLQGGFGNAVDMKNVERKDLERGARQTYEELWASGKGDVATGLLIYNNSTKNGKVVEMIRDNLQHDVEVTAGEQVSDAFMQQYAKWKLMYYGKGFKMVNGQIEKSDTSAGPATALAYYGPVIQKRMEMLDRQLRANMAPDVAYRMTFGADVQDQGGDLRGVDSTETKANAKAVRDAVDRQESGKIDRWFGEGQRLHPSTKAIIASSAAYYFEQLPDTLNPDDRARQAVNMARQNGLELAGRYGWTNGRGQQSIASYLNDNGEESGVVMDELITKKLRESGAGHGLVFDGDGALRSQSITIMRLPDQDGQPIIHALAWTENGVVDATVTGREMKNAYRLRVKRGTEGNVPQGMVRNADGHLEQSILPGPKL